MNTPLPRTAPPTVGGETGLGFVLYAVAVLLLIAGVILAVVMGNTFSLEDEFSGEESFNIGVAFGTFFGAFVQALTFFALGWIVEHVHKLERAVKTVAASDQLPPPAAASDQPLPPAAEGPDY